MTSPEGTSLPSVDVLNYPPPEIESGTLQLVNGGGGPGTSKTGTSSQGELVMSSRIR